MTDPFSLHQAILAGNLSEVRNLISQAEIKAAVNNIDSNGKTALILAVDLDNQAMIELLVKNGANVNQAVKGATALMIAAQLGKKEAAKALILAGADINKVVGFGKITALKLAKKHLTPADFDEMEQVFKTAQAEFSAEIKQQRGEQSERSSITDLKTPQKIGGKGIASGNIIPRKTQGR